MKYIFPLFLLLSSCASVQMTYLGDDKGLAAAHKAADQWKDVCGKEIYISRDFGGIPIRQVPSLKKVEPKATDNMAAATKVVDGKVAIVLFEPYGTDQFLTVLFAHEFGHVLGIRNKNHEPSGLMQETPVLTDKVTHNECMLLPDYQPIDHNSNERMNRGF
jgi:hypothetical protein